MSYAMYELSVADEFGNSAAVFINKLQYWLSRSKNKRDGKTWVFNSYEDWSKQLGISARTVQRVVKLLKEKGVIEVGCFNGVKWNRTQWYTLTEKWMKKISHVVHNHLDTVSKSMTSNSKTGKKECMNKQSTTAAEVLEKFKAKAVTPPEIADNPTLGQAERYWRQMYRVKYDMMLPPLTMKRVGQLKLILKRAEGKGGIVLRHALSSWPSCRAKIPHMTPDRPDIGNILTNLDVVLNWALKRQDDVQLIAKPVEVNQYEVVKPKVKDKPIWLEE
jgi:DNA-binding Lrp family transcriptional regulator